MTEDLEPAKTFYPVRLAALDAAYKRYFKRTDYLQKAMIVGFLLTAVTLYLLLRSAVAGSLLLWVLIATVAVMPVYLHMMRVRDRYLRLFVHYEWAVGRLDGTRTQSGNTGEEFREEGHLYERDLNVLGADSLFGMLDTVRTGVGQRGLAKLLLQPDESHAREAILARREAIQELTPQNALREKIAMLGPSRFQQVPAAFFDKWLEESVPEFHPAARIGMVATTGTVVLLAILGLTHVLPWDVARPNIFCALAIQATIALTVRRRVLPLLESSKNISAQMQLFRDGLELLQNESFSSQRLAALKQVAATPGDAVKLLAKIQHQFVIVEQRTKEWFLIPSLLLCAGTHAAMSIASWKRRNAAAMKLWLTAWAEFEALSALATYAYEHPENAYPEILAPGTAVFEATALAHPLLPANAVANDLALNRDTQTYIISGSNMAGKSTLLRSIGANAVLAATGAPIRAAAAKMAEFPELHAANVHMASADPADPLAFDYRLKPGVNRSSNALAIVKMMGIEID